MYLYLGVHVFDPLKNCFQFCELKVYESNVSLFKKKTPACFQRVSGATVVKISVPERRVCILQSSLFLLRRTSHIF